MGTEGLSAADVAAVTNNGGGLFGGNNGDWSFWIIILFLFAFAGGWGNGWGGQAGGQGAANNYVLASDFATIQRQLSDGFGGVEKGLDTIRNGLCDGFYTEAQLVNGVNMNIMQGVNGIQTQLADCCCKTQQNIKDTQYAIATTGAGIQAAIKDCCCENEKATMQTRYDMATMNCNTLQAIDKLGDRIIGHMDAAEKQNLRDENFALKLNASQAVQNQYLVNQLRPAPVPAFAVNPPYQYAACCNGCN